MNRPATTEGRPLMASTKIRTGRAQRLRISLRNTAVRKPSGTRDQRRPGRPARGCRRWRARRRRPWRLDERPDELAGLGEELEPQRVAAPLHDDVADEQHERHDAAPALPTRRRPSSIRSSAAPGRPARGRPASRCRGRRGTSRRRSQPAPSTGVSLEDQPGRARTRDSARPASDAGVAAARNDPAGAGRRGRVAGGGAACAMARRRRCAWPSDLDPDARADCGRRRPTRPC